MGERDGTLGAFCYCCCCCSLCPMETPASVLEPANPAAPMKRKARLRRRHHSGDSDKENIPPGIAKRLFTMEAKEEEGVNVCTEAKRKYEGAQFTESCPSMNQQVQNMFEKCPLLGLTGAVTPFHRTMREYSGLADEDITFSNLQKRSMMTNILRATLCSIIKRCSMDLRHTKCEGCVLDLGNQEGHECLNWGSEFYDETLKNVCKRLNTGPLIYVITVIACSLECFTMNQNHIISLSRMIASIHDSPAPGEALSCLLQKCHPKFLSLADLFLNKTFYNHDCLSAFL